MSIQFKTLDDIEKRYSISFEDEDLEFDDQILKIYNSLNPELLDLIDYDNLIILHWLGLYYEIVNVNIDLMTKYYLMAIEKDNVKSMFKLGYYYQFKEKDYIKMKKYYKMAIELGCIDSLNEIKSYYNNNYMEYYDFLKNFAHKIKIVINELNNLKLRYSELIYL